MYKMKMNKRGQSSLQNLSAAAIGVLVFILIVSIGALILSQVQSTQTNNSIAFNTTSLGLQGIALFGSFTSVIVLVVIAAVILALIAVAFRTFA
jgi:hypothetical protein